jgi:hypothetical protein
MGEITYYSPPFASSSSQQPTLDESQLAGNAFEEYSSQRNGESDEGTRTVRSMLLGNNRWHISTTLSVRMESDGRPRAGDLVCIACCSFEGNLLGESGSTLLV